MKLKEMVEKGQVFVPCIYDCFSAKAAQDAGFKAVLLSGGGLSYSLLGVPDMAFLTLDDLVRATERISNCVDLPIIVDGDDGYGESPAVVYRAVKRLIKAGAQAVTIDDSTGIRGFERYVDRAENPQKGRYIPKVVGREVWLAKISAAAEACENTDCFVIARTEAFSTYDINEVFTRCTSARALGAKMTLVCDGMDNKEEAEQISRHDPGWKMWPDYYSIDGKPCVDPVELEKMGFNLITFHVFEKAALYGMLLYSEKSKISKHKD